jgi:BirA family transcriptional regulator, biotin operon repressor / biotin---[acetyl-CoA-carboxylase] ligase
VVYAAVIEGPASQGAGPSLYPELVMWLALPAVEEALTTSFVGSRLLYYTSTSSTMDVARAEAEAGASEGTVVVAEEQTAGRGRFGRQWLSPAGKNIYLTLLLRPTVDQLRRLSIIAPLAVALAIEETTGLAPRIKWPNDVLLSGRKVAGILIETEFSGSAPRYALIGPGINVNFEIDLDSEIADIATSIKQELGADVAREAVLAALLNHIEALYTAPDPRAVREAWKSRLETLGRDVTLTFRDETYSGYADDVDDAGNLILRFPDGSTRTFEVGEVSLRVPQA